jgi:hypothetical protein
MSEISIDHAVDPETGDHTLAFEGTGFACRVVGIERTAQGRLYGTLYPTMRENELPIGEVSLLDSAARDRYALSLSSVNGAGPDYYKPFLNQIAKILDDDIPRPKTQRKGAPGDVWARRTSLADFLSNIVEMPEGLARDLIFPGAITAIAAPSGVGKTLIAYALSYTLATGGVFRDRKVKPARILLVDFDNPENLIKLRLRDICENTDVDMQVITRGDAPQLLDRPAWEALPAEDHNVVIIDSFGSATVGVTEKEGAKLEFALETLKLIADKGPAVVVLDNTQKAGVTYRGRGEKVERVEALFEARDVTNWAPSRGDAWWLDIPSANDADWQERAQRKTEQEIIRVAFVPRKFRLGQEPQPFVLQLDCHQAPWALSDVTQEIEDAGNQASQEEKATRQQKLLEAALALSRQVNSQFADTGAMRKTDAESVLQNECGLTQRMARGVLDSYDAEVFPAEGLWRLRRIPGSHGRKIGVFPLDEIVDDKKIDTDNSNNNNAPNDPSFCHPPAMAMTERLDLGTIENIDVTEPHLLVVNKDNPRDRNPCGHMTTRQDGANLVCVDCGEVLF